MRRQNVFHKEALIQAIHSHLDDVNAHDLAKLTGEIFNINLHPISSFDGQMFITENKLNNRHLISAAKAVPVDAKVREIISNTHAETPEKRFSRVTLALVKQGIHLSIDDIEKALQGNPYVST